MLFLEEFLGMDKSRANLQKLDFPLIGFAERTTYPLEVIILPVVLGNG